jgi:hypothetical protein
MWNELLVIGVVNEIPPLQIEVVVVAVSFEIAT